MSIYRDQKSPAAPPVSSLQIVVFFPFELHVSPYILRLPFTNFAVLAQTIINIKLQRTAIVENNSQRFMAMEEGNFCGQFDIQHSD
jgi:hypothetical protein